MNFVQSFEPGFGGLDAGLARQALEQRAHDDIGLKLAIVGQQFLVFFVEFADDARCVSPAVQHVLGKHLQKWPFFLDDKNFFQPLRKVLHHGGLHREQHAHFQDTNAVVAQRSGIQTHLQKGLIQVVVGLAGGDDAQPGIIVLEHHIVELVGTGVAFGDFKAAGIERLLHLQRLHPHVHAQVHLGCEGLAVKHQVGRGKVQSRRVNVGGASAVGHVGDNFHAHPQAGQA